MQQNLDLQQRIFSEIKNILENLVRSENSEELLSQKDQFPELAERLSFLKIFSENQNSLTLVHALEISDNQTLNSENNLPKSLSSEDFLHTPELEVPQEIIPEFIADKELNYSEEAETEAAVFEIPLEQIPQENVIEFEDKPSVSVADEFEDENQNSTSDKKFRIAPIKGLKSATEFSVETPSQESTLESPALHYKNFRLDLNDRIAFSNSLFGGNMEELDRVTERLNQFENMDDAKQYLSDIYYQKDWRKVDDFAQRLWGLVENKFL